MANKLNSLGLPTPPAKTRVVVAMSGGVDSSVVAGMLVAEGYEVVGITLQLYDVGKMRTGSAAKTCCAGADVYDARRVAGRLGIQHYVLDYESRFRTGVMEAFADSYVAGRTPVPCITCNQTVKFRDLLATAKELGAACLATGHYVRREVAADGELRLLRGVDGAKDQSYFLFATTRQQLEFLRFPLGGMEKAATRRLAAKYGLAVAAKADSQDICFVGRGGYGEVVRRLRPGAVDGGEIVDRHGRVLGRHNGVIDFTIGQRRGLGVGGRAGDGDGGSEGEGRGDDNAPLYVVAIRPEARQVVVGRREALACRRVMLEGCNWLAGDAGGGTGGEALVGRKVLARLRNTGPAEAAAIVAWDGEGRAELALATPQYGVAAGQAAVLYDADDGDWVLGGGWITAAPTEADGWDVGASGVGLAAEVDTGGQGV